MTDFIADLEAELVAAARRRGRRRAPRMSHALAAAAVVLVVVAGVLAVTRLDGPRPADELPAPPPDAGVAVTLPAAEGVRQCPGVETRPVAPKALPGPHYAVFSRPPLALDRPETTTVSARTLYSTFVRRAGHERFVDELWLAPVAGLRHGCERAVHDPGGGVCLLANGTATCFGHGSIQDGRAIALTRPGVVHGLVPDGVKAVTLSFGGRRITAPAVDNAYEIEAPVRAGEEVRVEMVAAPTCRPSPELVDAVPALRDARWVRLPAAVEEAVQGGGRPRYARRIQDRDGFQLWLLTTCDDGERACVVAVRAGRWFAMPCGTLADLRTHGASWIFPVEGRLAVAGLARTGADAVSVVLDDAAAVHEVPLEGGAFAAILPAQFGSSVDPGPGDMAGRIEIRYR